MITQDNCALLIVDIQGQLAEMMDDYQNFIKQTIALVKMAKILSLPIVWLEQYPQGLGKTVPQLAELLSDIEPLEKFTFSGLGTQTIKEQISNSTRSHWLVCGIEAHICVYQSVRDMLNLGYKVEIVSDCIRSRDPKNRAMAIERMISQGAQQTSFEMCAYELMQSAKNPAFKQLLPIVKSLS